MLDHIAVAVPDLEAALVKLAPFLGDGAVHREVVTDQGVQVAMVDMGNCHLEILCPLKEDSPVGKFLAKRGPGLHHMAFRVEDLPARLKELTDQGYDLIDTKPRRGAGGKDIAFVHPRSTGGLLVELCSPAQ